MNDTNESKYGILENVQLFQSKDLACNDDGSKKKELLRELDNIFADK